MGIINSREIHAFMADKLLRASFTQYFNKIVSGRILNRLSKDIYIVDYSIPSQLLTIFTSFLSLVSAFLTFILLNVLENNFYWHIPAILCMLLIGILIMVYYLRS